METGIIIIVILAIHSIVLLRIRKDLNQFQTWAKWVLICVPILPIIAFCLVFIGYLFIELGRRIGKWFWELIDVKY